MNKETWRDQLGWLRWIIPLVALVLAFTHVVAPTLGIDAITIGLILVALIPGLLPFLERIDFPGGGAITLRQLDQAGQKVTEVAPGISAKTAQLQASFLDIADRDPVLALAGLRIEIESRLRKMAEKRGMQGTRSLMQLVQDMQRSETLDNAVIGGLRDLIPLLNSAVHGGRVDPGAADWAITVGPDILAVLDANLDKAQPRNR